jgi:hypothetical protein
MVARLLSCLVFSLALSPALADSEDALRGEMLHGLRCMTCHNAGMYLRKQRKVTTVDDLRSQIQKWSVEAGLLDWTADEVEDIAAFLNQRYYRLECASSPC